MAIEVVELHPNEHPIETLYVFLGADEKGNQGILAAQTELGLSPMFTGSLRVVEKMKPLAMDIAAETGQAVSLWTFTRTGGADMDITDIKVRLDTAVLALNELRGHLDGTIKDDTAYAIGYLAGHVMRASALVERDMRDWDHDAKTSLRDVPDVLPREEERRGPERTDADRDVGRTRHNRSDRVAPYKIWMADLYECQSAGIRSSLATVCSQRVNNTIRE